MGCDIYVEIDIFDEERQEWLTDSYNSNRPSCPFAGRSYYIFGFLADVRNDSECPYFSKPRGLTADRQKFNDEFYANSGWGSHHPVVDEGDGHHSHSWALLSELLDYNYEQEFFDMYDKRKISLREFLTEADYFDQLKKLQAMYPKIKPENIRLFFCFDN